MKKTIYLSIVLLLSITVSCGKSVLTDIEIQDPTLIDMNVRITQKSDNEIFVDIRPTDKKYRFIRLKNGTVTVNGQSVDYKHSSLKDFDRAYRYKAKKGETNFNITVRYNSTDSYTFQYGTKEGFPGFGTTEVKTVFPDIPNSTIFYNTGNFYIRNATIPFRKGEIYISYHVYKKMEDMN